MSGRELTYGEAVREALAEEMRRDRTVFLIGEDVAEAGHPFKVLTGLVQEFGTDRVIDTPISEPGYAGIGVGAAMTGMRPVVDIMFGDFITLAMDQIVNQAAKVHYMSGGKLRVPIVFRTTLGATRRSAAQHSQSLHAWVSHIPGLKVALPSGPYEAKGLMKTAIRDDSPVVIFEDKMMYRVKGPVPEEDYTIPFGVAEIKREGRDITIVATSSMVAVALGAAKLLEEAGISAGSIYRHFATKEELYAAILDHKACSGGDSFEPQEMAADAIGRKDDRGVFESLALGALNHHEHDPEFQRLLLYSALEKHELAQMFFDGFVRKVYDFLGSYIRERQREGALIEIDPATSQSERITVGASPTALAVGDRAVGEEREHRRIQVEQAPVGGDPDQRGGDALRDRGEIVVGRAVVGIGVGVEHEVAVAGDQQAVDLAVAGSQLVEAVSQYGRVESLRLWVGRRPAVRPLGDGSGRRLAWSRWQVA